MERKYFCPSGAFDCPYFNSEDGSCSIDGIPWEECDDAMVYHDFEEDE